MALTRETQIFRRDVKSQGRLLTAKDREELLRPYLPSPSRQNELEARSTQPIRTFLKAQIYFLVYTIIHIVFSLYLRIRQAYHGIVNRVLAILYYHHRTPELIRKDVRDLSRLPQHLSVILELQSQKGGAELEILLDDLAELSAWCASAGLPVLSVYEKTGEMPDSVPRARNQANGYSRYP